MPELPEVETVARGLQLSVAGRRIVSVTLRKTDFIDDPAAIERELPGTKIERVERYGKFMLLQLVGGNTAQIINGGAWVAATSRALLVHLGMTGNMTTHLAEQPLEKHTHVLFGLDDGRELRFTDARRFGRMAYLAGEALAAELRRFGADPLLVSAQEFTERIRRSKARIKALLLDQSVLRGVGNIYADESLWSARIHPARSGASLAVKEVALLRKMLQRILRKAIELRGSTISDFVDGDGLAGEYQQHHKVYGRDGQKCLRCGGTIKWMVVAGRSSHYCPICQKAPRAVRRKAKKTKRTRQVRTSKR
jgi:formamidopyrimidine-DNA glycosylase